MCMTIKLQHNPKKKSEICEIKTLQPCELLFDWQMVGVDNALFFCAAKLRHSDSFHIDLQKYLENCKFSYVYQWNEANLLLSSASVQEQIRGLFSVLLPPIEKIKGFN